MLVRRKTLLYRAIFYDGTNVAEVCEFLCNAPIGWMKPPCWITVHDRVADGDTVECWHPTDFKTFFEPFLSNAPPLKPRRPPNGRHR